MQDIKQHIRTLGIELPAPGIPVVAGGSAENLAELLAIREAAKQ